LRCWLRAQLKTPLPQYLQNFFGAQKRRNFYYTSITSSNFDQFSKFLKIIYCIHLNINLISFSCHQYLCYRCDTSSFCCSKNFSKFLELRLTSICTSASIIFSSYYTDHAEEYFEVELIKISASGWRISFDQLLFWFCEFWSYLIKLFDWIYSIM
jgi:hypothetical protein